MGATPPFKVLKQSLSTAAVRGVSKVNNSYEEILGIISLLLRGVEVDETWYLTQYPHLADALKTGEIKSARNHFIHSGYFEGRLPREPEFDEKWYLAQYPDVAEGIARGEIKSAREHYLEHGYAEGRICSADEALS
ncbi:MAG TPA: hypothetical protein VH722_16540 [Alphaproteobacteria bacterium]|nr:hypothetical protein [Alphaproteobacteria bacterium]